MPRWSVNPYDSLWFQKISAFFMLVTKKKICKPLLTDLCSSLSLSNINFCRKAHTGFIFIFFCPWENKWRSARFKIWVYITVAMWYYDKINKQIGIQQLSQTFVDISQGGVLVYSGQYTIWIIVADINYKGHLAINLSFLKFFKWYFFQVTYFNLFGPFTSFTPFFLSL